MNEGGQMLGKFLIVILGISTLAAAQQAPSGAGAATPTAATAAPVGGPGAPTVAAVLDRQLSRIERELLPMVKEMPGDKFNFAPTNGEFKGVRTFAEQIKHLIGGSFRIAAAILGEKPPLGAEALLGANTKDQSVKLLSDAFAYTHKAFASITEKNLVEPIPSPFASSGTTTRLDLAIALMADQRDHYGQMVVYFRMNGMVPPASRR
jgi:hypothetical protein